MGPRQVCGGLVKPRACRETPLQVLTGRPWPSVPCLGCAHMLGLKRLPSHLENRTEGYASAAPSKGLCGALLSGQRAHPVPGLPSVSAHVCGLGTLQTSLGGVRQGGTVTCFVEGKEGHKGLSARGPGESWHGRAGV